MEELATIGIINFLTEEIKTYFGRYRLSLLRELIDSSTNLNGGEIYPLKNGTVMIVKSVEDTKEMDIIIVKNTLSTLSPNIKNFSHFEGSAYNPFLEISRLEMVH